MNPLTLLDSLLEDYLSPKARRTLHTVLVLAALAVTAVLTYNGDWREAALSLATAVYAWANRANTGVTTLGEAKAAMHSHGAYHETDVSSSADAFDV